MRKHIYIGSSDGRFLAACDVNRRCLLQYKTGTLLFGLLVFICKRCWWNDHLLRCMLIQYSSLFIKPCAYCKLKKWLLDISKHEFNTFTNWVHVWKELIMPFARIVVLMLEDLKLYNTAVVNRNQTWLQHLAQKQRCIAAGELQNTALKLYMALCGMSDQTGSGSKWTQLSRTQSGKWEHSWQLYSYKS